MFTAEQHRKVCNFIVKNTGKFATPALLYKIYEIDTAAHRELVAEGHYTGTYADFLQEVWDDDYGAGCAFLDVVEEAQLQMES